MPARPRPEAIALSIHQIAATAGVMAAGQEGPLSHALHLIEASLLDVAERVERLGRLFCRCRVIQR